MVGRLLVLIRSLGCLAVSAGIATAAPPPAPLPRPGAPLERRLAGGEAHRYALPAGELWLTVVQQGIDVVVAAVGPDGGPLLTVDSPNGRWGDEPLLFRAEGPGPWQLEVRSPEAAAAPGSYRLRVAPPDPRQAVPRRAATEAGRLFFAGGAEAGRRALGQYREALAAWQTLGATAEAAGTLFNLAMLHRSLGEPREALALHRLSLPLWQRLGERRGEARAWMESGSAAWALGESREASPDYRRALKLWRTLGDRDGQARTLNYLGLVLGQDDPRQAIAPYEAALALFRQTGDRRQQGVVLNNLGGVQDQLGEPQRALEHYRQALRLQRDLGDVGQEALVWNNIAAVYRRTGRLQDALEAFDRALAGLRGTADRAGEASVLNNLGITHLRLGDTARAFGELQEALRLRRASQDRRGEATTLHNLGLVRAGQGQWELAAAFHEQALALRRATGDRGGEAATLYELGRTAGELGRTNAARHSLEAALAILAETGNRWREGLARAALGQVLTDSGEPAPAVDQLARALELLRAAGDPIGESEALLGLARAERAAGPSRPSRPSQMEALVRAEGHAAAALALLEPLRANLDSAGLRTAFLSRHGDAFEVAVDLALELDRRHPGAGWAARALERSEQARARTLLDLLRQAGAGRRRGVSSALLTRQSRLLDRLNAKVEQRRLLLDRQGTRAGGDARRLAGELREVQRQLEAVESALRRQSAGRYALALPRPLRAVAIQALLDGDTMLLEYALGTERSALWAVTRDRIESFELPAREVIETLARQAYESFSTLDPRPRDEEAAAVARLSGLLFGPVAPRLAGQRLVIVADGALHYLPFAALQQPGGTEPLLVRHEVVSLPSASALAVQRQTLAGQSDMAKTLAGRSLAGRSLAILADPVFGPPDPRLPRMAETGPAAGFDRLAWSGREAESIAAQAPAGETLLALGFDASRDTALDRLRGYRLVHFATHGVLDSAHPELSALVLSLRGPDGRPREGMLRLPEIYNLDLDAELVVLSGCRTALGPQIRGEGLVGLARGFFAAGARRLVASLWQVQDRASAELMERFYRRLLHGPPEQRMRPAAALRAAQLELRADPGRRAPYYWAAFAAYGDWR